LINAFLANGASLKKCSVSWTALQGNRGIGRQHIFRLNKTDYLYWGAKVPRKLVNAWIEYLRAISDMTSLILSGRWRGYPAGFYDGLVWSVISPDTGKMGYSNQFGELSKELYIIATDWIVASEPFSAQDTSKRPSHLLWRLLPHCPLSISL